MQTRTKIRFMAHVVLRRHLVVRLRLLLVVRRLPGTVRHQGKYPGRLPLACRPSRQMALARHLISRGIQPKSPATATRRRRLRAASL